jgi:hypothetical protein
MNVAPLYRPQLGGGANGQPQQLGVGDRDDRGRNGGYQDASPLSPSTGSDFSFSKYSNDTYSQQRNLGYNNDPQQLANSTSNNSIMSQGSPGSIPTARDSVVMEHYTALKKYLTRLLSAEGRC